eukprot:NODE_6813_length_433_cov_364.231771_g5214_i0.p3 GENE.NODE_6813_length_433_cov_364.231771_g5214_i0~~NODE_6813_length_433_cov_364.231771_g5214_i0.p3  ORF type:complete len:57 (+),score=0.18 NODE_6813_length_433_cov_364.231771_g5214_i0:176-346(+)
MHTANTHNEAETPTYNTHAPCVRGARANVRTRTQACVRAADGNAYTDTACTYYNRV